MSLKPAIFVVFAIGVVLFGLSCSSPTAPNGKDPGDPDDPGDTPKATNPSPADGATDVGFSEKLTWEIDDTGTYTYDIYFGTESPPPSAGTGLTEKTHDPGGLTYDTTYYWRVDTNGEAGTATGDEWSFTTRSAYTGYCRHMPIDVGNRWVYRKDVDGVISEFACEVLSAAGVHENFEYYVMEHRENGEPYREFYGGCNGNRCYLCFQSGSTPWLYLIGDEMALHSTTETGCMVRWEEMEYNEDTTVTVTAGTFENCKVLYHYRYSGIPFINETLEWWWEFYAYDVGLVYAEYARLERVWIIIPIETWYVTTYDLQEYEIHH
jgi:hypothetical protein